MVRHERTLHGDLWSRLNETASGLSRFFHLAAKGLTTEPSALGPARTKTSQRDAAAAPYLDSNSSDDADTHMEEAGVRSPVVASPNAAAVNASQLSNAEFPLAHLPSPSSETHQAMMRLSNTDTQEQGHNSIAQSVHFPVDDEFSASIYGHDAVTPQNYITQHRNMMIDFDDPNFFALLPGISSEEFQDFTFPSYNDILHTALPFDQSPMLSTNPEPQHRSTASGDQFGVPARLLNDSPRGQNIPRVPGGFGSTNGSAVGSESRTVVGALNNVSDGPKTGLPQIVREPYMKPPRLSFDEVMRLNLLDDLHSRLSLVERNSIVVPSANIIEKCLQSYFECFHIHLPTFHLQTIDFCMMQSPLLLSMCAIGALYRLERKTAGTLFLIAEKALDNSLLEDKNLGIQPIGDVFSDPTQTQSQSVPLRPMWIMQCKLLLTFFAMFSWDAAIVRRATDQMSFLSGVRAPFPTLATLLTQDRNSTCGPCRYGPRSGHERK